MGVVRVLPEFIANKIAAGEVVERPSSIVKELVENALDAKAASIEVEIQHGGKSLIRVSDNGCGMAPEDARVAFQRHATSKISALEDLEEIRSFGFRGEALPSIAAVSRCRLVTRASGSSIGTEVVIEGGNLKGVQEHPCREGTIVEVRDLFFNTPARRKFLKSEVTELGHLLEVVSRAALASPGLRLLVRTGPKVLLDLPPTDQWDTRIAGVLGQEVGAEFLRLEGEKKGIRLLGWMAKPTLNRGNRSRIYLFVNGRWVRSLPLSYALQAGYQGLLMEGRYPVAVLFVDLDLRRVDVNVHPTKQEVRISDEPAVTRLIQEMVRERLRRTPSLAPTLGSARKDPAEGVSPQDREYLLRAPGSSWGAVFDKPNMTWTASASGPVLSPISLRDASRITRILGQIHRTFILAETEEGFVVVDQHAAHERVVFEALLRNIQAGHADRQMLFLDEILQVHPRQREILNQAMPLLHEVGFDLEPFGEGSWVIRAYPAVLGEIRPVELVQSFLDQLEDGKVRTVLEDRQGAVAALCACKRQSVKAGDPLEPRQMQMLLERLAACEDPFTCPHGRPVFFTQTVSNLEKQFKRV